MGICNYCYQQNSGEDLELVKAITFKAGPQFNGINFTLTNKSLHQFKGDCVVFYADHVSQLSRNHAFTQLHKKTKRKIFQYLNLAQQQAQKNQIRHYLVPINIPSFKYKNIMFVKLQPWDGHSVQKIQKKIYEMTVGYLQSFKLRKIKNMTIIQFDVFSGIHYSISFPVLQQSIREFSSQIKNVNIVCNSTESIDYYYKNISKNDKNSDIQDQRKKSRQDKQKSLKKEQEKLIY